MIPEEVKLWVHLRSWRKRGFDFRRQAPRDGHVIDFICLKHRLMVEVDGGQHNFAAHARRDAERDNHFAGRGFTVLRFWNNEVDRNLEGVLTMIDDALRNPRPASHRSATSPSGGGIEPDIANQPVSLSGGASCQMRSPRRRR